MAGPVGSGASKSHNPHRFLQCIDLHARGVPRPSNHGSTQRVSPIESSCPHRWSHAMPFRTTRVAVRIRSQSRRLHYDRSRSGAPIFSERRKCSSSVHVKYRGPKRILDAGHAESNLGKSKSWCSRPTWARRAGWWGDGLKAYRLMITPATDNCDQMAFPLTVRCSPFPRRGVIDSSDDSDWGTAQVVAALHVGSFGRTRPPPTNPYGPFYTKAPLGA